METLLASIQHEFRPKVIVLNAPPTCILACRNANATSKARTRILSKDSFMRTGETSRSASSTNRLMSRFKCNADEGLLVAILKWLLFVPVSLWHRAIHRALYPLSEFLGHRIARAYPEKKGTAIEKEFATDCYKLLMSLFVAILYCLIQLPDFGGLSFGAQIFVFGGASVFAAGRIVELFGVLLVLHSDNAYMSVPARK